MEDAKIVNGDNDDFYDPDHVESDKASMVTELTGKIDELQTGNHEMTAENVEIKERIKSLTEEIEELRGTESEMKRKLEEMEREMDRADEDKTILETIANRAVELETELSRLQHELITAMNEGDETNAEVADLKKILLDKVVLVEGLEKEMEFLKVEKGEIDTKVTELENKLGKLEVRELDERIRRVRVEEEMREKIDEKEKEINVFKKKVGNLESEVGNSFSELDNLKFEKNGLDEALKQSKDKLNSVELKLLYLQKDVKEAEKIIGGLREKTAEAINGTTAEIMETIEGGGGGGGRKGSKSNWPVTIAAGSAGTIALAAAVVYVSGRRR